MSLNLVILLGTVRSDRRGIRVARFVERLMTARSHTVTLVDPIVLKLALLDRMYKEYAHGREHKAFRTSEGPPPPFRRCQ